MKKLFLLLTLALFCMITPAFANDSAQEILEITGGFSGKKTEVTFDQTRSITGHAAKNTQVLITVSIPNPEFNPESPEGEDNFRYAVKCSCEISVGALGIFSQDIELYDGTNIIDISAQNDGGQWEAQYKIIRKSLEIKQELEGQSIILPGQFLTINTGD